MSYGKIIPGLEIHNKPAPYGVFNERGIRATAGIMMLVGFITFMIVYTTRDFIYLYPTLIAFLLQFLVVVVRGPYIAPFSVLGKWLVRKQKVEYVGAIQKRFAWSLGLAMAIAMLVATAGFGLTGIVPFAIFLTCLFLMRMESVLGICVGCNIYYGLIKLGRIKPPEHNPACPGGACEIS